MDFFSNGRFFNKNENEQNTNTGGAMENTSLPQGNPIIQRQRQILGRTPSNMSTQGVSTQPNTMPNRQASTQMPSSSAPMSSAALVQSSSAVPQQRPTFQASKITDPEVEVLGPINEVKFSDVYVIPDKRCFIWGEKSNCGLKCVSFSDFDEFFAELEKAYEGVRSYLLKYKGRNYRVERTIALEGPQYCARKMPIELPDLKKLNFPSGLLSHLFSLANATGLILLAGATGSGKSTTIAALLKEFLERNGGYAYTIEDPIEMPLDGIYQTKNGELGLCKQTTPPDGLWEEGIKSALRSKPRYIYLGEIRSPDVASEALRAATSGHLVLSTIHANNVSDAINSLVKYAASSGISEEMAYELVANGFLGCIHQVLTGAPKRAVLTYLFANPDINAGCPVRGMFRSGKLNVSTLMDQQKVKLERNLPIFSRI